MGFVDRIQKMLKNRVGVNEVPDPTPMAIPIGFKRPETLAEQVRRLVRSEQLSSYARSQGMESFEEAEDFDVDDDFDPRTPYELEFDPAVGKEITRGEKQHLDRARGEFDQEVAVAKKRRKQVERSDGSTRQPAGTSQPSQLSSAGSPSGTQKQGSRTQD